LSWWSHSPVGVAQLWIVAVSGVRIEKINGRR